MRLSIGTRRLPGSDGRITVRGRSQIALEWGQRDAVLELTMDLYDAGGHHIARLRRNHWTFNDRDRFTFTGSSTGFHVVDTKLEQVVLRARIVGRDSVAITQGAFFNAAGDAIDVTSERWETSPPPPPSDSRRAHLTNPYYGPDDVVTISAALASAADRLECPRCGCPLTCERLNGAVQDDRTLVSCLVCQRNLIVVGGK